MTCLPQYLLPRHQLNISSLLCNPFSPPTFPPPQLNRSPPHQAKMHLSQLMLNQMTSLSLQHPTRLTLNTLAPSYLLNQMASNRFRDGKLMSGASGWLLTLILRALCKTDWMKANPARGPSVTKEYGKYWVELGNEGQQV